MEKKIQPNRKKSKSFNLFKKKYKESDKSANQIKILFLWVDSDRPPFTFLSYSVKVCNESCHHNTEVSFSNFQPELQR